MPIQTPGSRCERSRSALLISDTEPRRIATAAFGRKHRQRAGFRQAEGSAAAVGRSVTAVAARNDGRYR